MRNYDFNADLVLSKKAERDFGKWLESKGCTEVEYAPDEVFHDWDVKFRSDTYEIKFDRWLQNTGNICVETYSCLENNSFGWFYKTKAKWLIIFYTDKDFIGVSMEKLRDCFYDKPEVWRQIKITQTSWTTICWLTNIYNIEDISLGRLE